MDHSGVEAWHDFLVAQASAGAALAGLVFVAISINLSRVVSVRALTGRAFEAVILLTLLPVVALLALVPDPNDLTLGIEFAGFGIASAVAVLRINLKSGRGEATTTQWLVRLVLGLAATVPVAIAGIGLIAGWNGSLYWLPVSATCGIIAGMAGAWVLLVEILR